MTRSARCTAQTLAPHRGGAPLWQVQALLALWLLLTATASAQPMVTEIVPSGFRSAEELATTLRPLIPSPGSVSAFENQLVIRTTPENLRQLRALLVSLDKAPANLLISVRRSMDAEISRDLARARIALRGAAGSARIGAQGNRSAGAGAALRRGGAGVELDSRTLSSQDNSTQRVRVLEGKEAFIQTGESIPVGERQLIVSGTGALVSESTRYEEFGTGFWARARLQGDRVTLDIYPEQRLQGSSGSANVHRTSTSVSGTLGQWMEIGAVNARGARERSAIGSSRSITTRRQQSTYVKVERVH